MDEKEYNKYHEKDENIKPFDQYLKDEKKVCYNCGSSMCVFEINQINDGKYTYYFDCKVLLCNGCIDNYFEMLKERKEVGSFVSFFNIVGK